MAKRAGRLASRLPVISRTTGRLRPITKFSADVIAPKSIDEAAGYFYFTASPASATSNLSVSLAVDGVGTPEHVTRLARAGTHSYDIAPNGEWAIHSYSSALHPPSVELVNSGRKESCACCSKANEVLAHKDAGHRSHPGSLSEEAPVGGGVQ